MSTATGARRRTPPWSAAALFALREAPGCPVCDAAAVSDRRCRACGADYTELGDELWTASQAAAVALEARQAVLDRVPLVSAAPATPAPAAPRSLSAPPAPREGSSATVQSVLALAGAGLVAVAAIVFTFFNPDLTDRAVRGAIVAAITLVFLAGARVLARRRLRFSAEAVGALGLVFVGLDVSSVAGLSRSELSPWVLTAIATLVAGSVMAALGVLVRLRVWLWTSLIALALVPAMFALAAGRGVGMLAGSLATAGAAFALLRLSRRFRRRFDRRLRAEGIALTVVQFVFVGIAVLPIWTSGSPNGFAVAAGALLAVTALALVSTKHPAGALWSLVAGVSLIGAASSAGLAVVPEPWSNAWAWVAMLPAAAGVGLVVAGAGLPTPRALRRAVFHAGALLAMGAAALPAFLWAGRLGVSTVFGTGDGASHPGTSAAVAVGLLAVAIGLATFGVLATRSGVDTRWVARVGLWSAVAAALVTLTSTELPLWMLVAQGSCYAIAASVALLTLPPLRASTLATRLPIIVGAHGALIFVGILSWRSDAVVVWAGAAIVAALVPVARTLPSGVHFWHVGVGYAYALVIFATGLHQLGLGSIALLCLTTTVGGVGAIVATFAPAVRPRAWWAVLSVTFVPFLVGVAQVIFERSGWTALSTAVIFALALALVQTRRPGLGTGLRAFAAAILIPSLAVVAVCLGAQLLEVSGSPVVLPVIAALVALVLPSLPAIRLALTERVGARSASAAERGIEASALVTAAITVGLALVRDSAGLGTTLLVLVVLGVGAGAAARWGRRRYGWWLTGASFTGALWCAWALGGVAVFEPYLLPPTLGAALVGLLVTARSGRGEAIYAAGLSLAVVPVVVVLAVAGSGGDAPWRAYGLVAAAWVLLGIGLALGRGASPAAARLRRLRPWTLAVAIAAGAAGAVQAARGGFALDGSFGPAPGSAVPALLTFVALGAAGALPAALAGVSLRRGANAGGTLSTTRWLLAPATLYVAVAAWSAIHRDWFTIWAMWALMLVVLAAMLAVAVRARARATGLPPVPFLFAVAFVTAVVAWSPRDLRVEWFSLPLGAFLLAAGATAMATRASDSGHEQRRLADWPRGRRGSWPLLAPGLVVLLSASVAATFTDPLTWRAILVLAIALAAILVGAGARLAAPFLIGIIVLPVENIIAFIVQIGRGIESMPWWITLSVVGAVLLIIAVTYERREGEGSGIAARLRDLR